MDVDIVVLFELETDMFGHRLDRETEQIVILGQLGVLPFGLSGLVD